MIFLPLLLSFLFLLKPASAACGGYLTGLSGTIDGTFIPDSDHTCVWDIQVEKGYIIELLFNYFGFADDCATADGDPCTYLETDPGSGNAFCKSNLRVEDKLGSPDKLFCKAAAKSPTGLIRSSGNSVTVTMMRASGSSSKFVASWRAVSSTSLCCNKLTFDADPNALFKSNADLLPYLGTYTLTAKENVYQNDANPERLLSRMSSSYLRSWMFVNGSDYEAGGNRGVMYFGSGDRGCTPSVAGDYDYLKTDGTFETATDSKPVFFSCATVCKVTPKQPPNSDISGSISTAKDSLSTYTCKTASSSFKVYSLCQANGIWSPLFGTCPATPEKQLDLLEHNSPTITLDSKKKCVRVMSPGYPSKPYSSGSYTWKFKAGDECGSLHVSFDKDVFDVPGTNSGRNKICTLGDKVSVYMASMEVKKGCGKVAPTDTEIINNEGQENRVELRAGRASSPGIGFKAVICAQDCGSKSRVSGKRLRKK